MWWRRFPNYDNIKVKHLPAMSLAEAIGFNEDDLDHNRDGYLSERQRQALLGKPWPRYAALIAVTLALAAGALFVFVDQLRVDSPHTGHKTVLLLFAVVEVIAVVFIVVPYSSYRQDAQGMVADSVQGHVSLDVEGGGNTVIYTLEISGERFTLDKHVFLAFKNDEPYVVYFAPHSRKLLAAEWLRETGII